MTNDNKEILVLGGSGTIGSAVVAQLRSRGAIVHVPGRDHDWEPKVPYGLVCCFGDYGVEGKFENVSFTDWAFGFQLNFISQAREVHRFLKLLNGRHGRIVLMGGAGIGSGAIVENRSSYASAKGALAHFVEAVSHELPNVAINVVAPGPVVSRMTRGHLTEGGSPSLAANLVEWLILGESSAVTGRLLSARWDTWPVSNLANDTYRLRRVHKV